MKKFLAQTLYTITVSIVAQTLGFLVVRKINQYLEDQE